MFRKYRLWDILKNIFFGNGQSREKYNQTPSEKFNVKSEKEERRILFVNLRLRNAIMVDKAEVFMKNSRTKNTQC